MQSFERHNRRSRATALKQEAEDQAALLRGDTMRGETTSERFPRLSILDQMARQADMIARLADLAARS
jgi:hypothetical protein